MPHERLSPFRAYVAPAGRRRGFWRVICGTVLIVAMWLIGATGLLLLWQTVGGLPLSGARETGGAPVLGGGPEATAMLLLSFAGIWAGTFLATRWLHGQPFGTLFAPDSSVRAGELRDGFMLAAGITILSFVVGLSVVGLPRRGLPPDLWVLLAPPFVALILLQATAEELLFRGYLLQQLALRSRNPLVWAVLPSLLFGALHYSGTLPSAAAGLYVAVTTLMGIALAVLVWRTGSLWTAIGVHVGFNVVGLLVVGAEGMLSGTQLFLYRQEDAVALMWVELGATLILLILVLRPGGQRRRI